MSKFGFHKTIGPATGYAQYLKMCHDAGSPVAVIMGVDQDVSADVLANSPGTITIFRTQKSATGASIGDAPANMYEGDLTRARQIADAWMDLILPVWALNSRHNYFAPINEQDPPGWLLPWLDAFMVRCMERAEAAGYKVGLYNFSTGNPRDATPEDPTSAEQKWEKLLPSMQRAKANGHILLLHEYGLNSPATGDAPANTLRASAPSMALRYRRVLDYLRLHNADARIVISECSAGNGILPVLNELTEDQVYADFVWYDSELMQDERVIGFCAYQIGGAENLFLRPALTSRIFNYIASTPQPTPGDCRGKPRVQYTRNYVLLPDRSRYDGNWYAAGGVLGYTVGKSADDAGIGDLDNRIVYAVNPEEWGGDLTGWYNTHYPGVEVRNISAGTPDALRTALLTGVKPPPNTGRVVLSQTPYLSQLSPTASYASGDCGSAVVAMWLGLRGTTVTVDDVSRATGYPPGFTSLSNADLSRVAAIYGLTLKHGYDLTIDHIKDEIDSGHPCIALINYGALPAESKYNQSYTRGHYFLVVGYDNNGLIYHDPYWPGNDGAFKYISNIAFDTAWGTLPANGDFTLKRQLLMYKPPAASPTPYFGLGHGTQDEIPQSHVDLYGRAFVSDARPAFKFLTLPDYGAMSRSIQRVKAKTPSAFLMARIFFSVGNTPFSPEDFVNYSHSGVSASYAQGIRDYELGNEWNIEGMGVNWTNGVQNGNWLKQVATILKGRYPDIRLWYPGLSPNPGAPQFFQESLSTGLGSLLHGYCFHSYFWTESGGQYNMVDRSGGLSWLDLRDVLPASERAKPVSISEFSCNTRNVSNNVKGGMYRRYRAVLQQYNVHSAFAFVLHWYGDDANKENWVNLNGSSTGIVEGYLS